MPQATTVIERRWNSHPINVHHARLAVRSCVEQYLRAELDLIELAIGEACANAVEHGSPCGEQSSFIVRCVVAPERQEIVFEVEDEGQDFALSHLSMKHVPDLESEGGRGLFLINQIMDEVAIHAMSTGLVVRMVKRVAEWPLD